MTTVRGAGRRRNLIRLPGTKSGCAAVTANVRHVILTCQAVGPDIVPGDVARFDENADGGLLLMVTDVTSLKQAEEALREKESVLRSFYDSSVMAMGVVELSEMDTQVRIGQRAGRQVLRRRHWHARREIGPSDQRPAGDALDVDRPIPRVPADRPPGPVRVPGAVSEQPGVGCGHAIAHGPPAVGAGPVLVHCRRHHRPEAHRGRPGRGQGARRGGLSRQGPFSCRTQPRTPDAAHTRLDRRRVASGVQARLGTACRRWR